MVTRIMPFPFPPLSFVLPLTVTGGAGDRQPAIGSGEKRSEKPDGLGGERERFPLTEGKAGV